MRRLRAPLSMATVLTAALLLGTVGPQSATAASSAPRFLSKDQIPTESRFSGWSQTRIVTGLADAEDCGQRALPRKTTRHRTIYNDEQGNQITQYVVRTSSTSAAKKLVRRLEYCGSKAEAATRPEDPSAGKVTYRTYGDYDIENGLLVRAATSRGGEYPERVFLDAVGRDGRYVLALRWPFDTEDPAPKDVWIAVSKTALRQLLP